MKTIEQIDKNFAIPSDFEMEDMSFFDVLNKPFKIYGLMHDKDGCFMRMDEKTAKSVSEGVYALFRNTAGGRVRFRTNSNKIAISAQYNSIGRMSHFALCGSAGFDMYVDSKYTATFRPPYDIEGKFESVQETDSTVMKEIEINFPLYSGVDKLLIGVEKGSILEEGKEYKIKKPVVYYGSSITQGGCASRPGNAYQAIISRFLDCDFVNLGFSGNAKGEDEIAKYISRLDMSAFVYDYDHNASEVAHLAKTHEPMFIKIREKNPTLPIIMLSRTDTARYDAIKEYTRERRHIIMDTYINALNRGDKNVYFIDGEKIFDIFGGDSCTVDGIHPNDLGFMCMAKVIGNELKKVLF